MPIGHNRGVRVNEDSDAFRVDDILARSDLVQHGWYANDAIRFRKFLDHCSRNWPQVIESNAATRASVDAMWSKLGLDPK